MMVRYSVKSTLVKYAQALLCRLPAIPTVDGHIVTVPTSMAGDCRLNILLARYEQSEISIVKQNLVPDDTIIEIGANLGVVASYALEKLKSRGKYIGIEPNPFSHASLETNLRRNQKKYPGIRFEIVNSAICPNGFGNALADYYVSPGLGSGLHDHTTPKSENYSIQVPIRSFSSIIAEYAPNGASVICDAEGAEVLMLRHESDAFSKVRQLIIELHGPEKTGHEETPETMLSTFERLGFTVKNAQGSCYYLHQNL